MKWVSHKLITGSVVFVVTGNVFSVLSSMAGSIFPDLIEGYPGDKGSFKYEVWKQRHRQLSHWFVPYLFLALISLLSSDFSAIRHMSLPEIWPVWGYRSVWLYFAGFFFVGCLFHILEDSLCGRVPAVNPNGKIGVRLIGTGTLLEYVVIFAVVGLTYVFYRNFGG